MIIQAGYIYSTLVFIINSLSPQAFNFEGFLQDSKGTTETVLDSPLIV